MAGAQKGPEGGWPSSGFEHRRSPWLSETLGGPCPTALGISLLELLTDHVS